MTKRAIPIFTFQPLYAFHGESKSIDVYPPRELPVMSIIKTTEDKKPPKDVEKPRLIKAAEACRLLSICQKTLWVRTNSGEIPHVRIGKSVRYDVKKLENWILAIEQ